MGPKTPREKLSGGL